MQEIFKFSDGYEMALLITPYSDYVAITAKDELDIQYTEVVSLIGITKENFASRKLDACNKIRGKMFSNNDIFKDIFGGTF